MKVAVQLHILTSALTEVCDQLHTPTALLPGEKSRNPLDYRLAGSHQPSEYFRRREKSHFTAYNQNPLPWSSSSCSGDCT